MAMFCPIGETRRTYAENVEAQFGPCRDASIEVARAMERFLDELQKIPQCVRPAAVIVIERMFGTALKTARDISAESVQRGSPQ